MKILDLWLSGFPDRTTSPRPLHPLQVDKEVVAVNSNNIIIEQLQPYETTDGMQAGRSSPATSTSSGLWWWSSSKLSPSRICWCSFCTWKVTQTFVRKKILHNIFKFFHRRDSQRPPECWAFFPTVLWLLNSLHLHSRLVDWILTSKCNNCFQTEQRAARYTKILFLGRFLHSGVFAKIFKFIKNAKWKVILCVVCRYVRWKK